MAEPDPDASARGHAELEISAVDVPPPDGSGAASDVKELPQELLVCHALRQQHELSLWGNLDRCPTLPEAVEYWRGNRYEERHVYLARLDGEVIGMCTMELSLHENTHTAGIDVLIAPAQRRQGLGRALLEHAEGLARERGRTSLYGYHEVPPMAVGGAAVPAKSGAGALPLDEPAVAFAVAAGYELEQVERSSRLTLPVPPHLLARLETEAGALAGQYDIIGWDDSCPEELVNGHALLKATMSTDVPIAGLDWEGENWDSARVREDERALIGTGVQSAVTAALHRPTGELVAYTVLNWRPGVPATISQQDTLVSGAHRGHRLGMMIKIANLRRAQRRWPAAKSVLTWNASENQHMLAINISLGFKPDGYEGEWQKRLG
ncbi:GNAT family N-acetyltransferase [Arthrobacter sp. CDRTa11]|uniref:GNAT family N-acetyltransferase n=1 Tax=Arthrobacter sp. CDRTa11 TaxID=2651199 RepID=UPI0022658676|nr:GNAT family N-acetyltransferase [Arthrobacter sp. CDRTa11]UZX04163.1 GNAT family N-acetyltransferase [Arthrobacter sp. CDRTa11]